MEDYKQHRLILSLGSNMGNRFENLQDVLHHLFEEVGAIRKISPVYETPALGFVGDAFLNAVVAVDTVLSPEKSLETVLQIERKMGRIRTLNSGYTSRPIDIDILFYDDLVIDQPDLVIPHPEIQNRKFVLLPLERVVGDFQHPVFKKNTEQLLAETSDTTAAEKLNKWLHNPMREFDFSALKYLVVEGNLGVGKTSLTKQIASEFNAKLILERFKENPFLPKFYKDPDRYALPVEMSFLADRYRQLTDNLGQLDLFKDWVIADYEISKSLIFAGITLPEDEFLLYRKIFYTMVQDFPKPDKYVYLHQDIDRLMANIDRRGRDFERDIQADYLRKVDREYKAFISRKPFENMMVIDVSDLDFVANRADYLKVLRTIAT